MMSSNLWQPILDNNKCKGFPAEALEENSLWSPLQGSWAEGGHSILELAVPGSSLRQILSPGLHLR